MITEYVQSNDKEKINRMIDYAIKTNKLYAPKPEVIQQDLKSTGIGEEGQESITSVVKDTEEEPVRTEEQDEDPDEEAEPVRRRLSC